MIRAAKYLGVPPWELAKQPQYWTELAIAFESAETAAEQGRNKPKGRVAGANRGRTRN